MNQHALPKFPSLMIFGPPGSGKGTQSKIIESLFLGKLLHLSSGDLFRGLKKGSPESRLFHQYADHGKLVPDKETIEIWYGYMKGLIEDGVYNPQEQKLLLDGIPRTLEQAEFMQPYIEVEKIIVLQIEDTDALAERLMKRAKVLNRKDDINPDVIKTRMDVYARDTANVLQAYPKDIQILVDAAQEPKDVLKDILNLW
ncbi:MAG: nucleoside monophosphate kinase [Chlamydiales bacterium]|nr:nucleoside monophosphate kinase [Chlamydiales bacterium]